MSNENKTLEYWIELAKKIAVAAHEGQTRNDKRTPYIKHPEEVANAVEKRLQPIAWLHDTVEDSKGKVTLDTLREAGFPQYIIDAVDVLTHIATDTNMVYWNKIMKNSDAVIVKIADIKANLSGNPSQYARDKYARALKLFADNGFSM
jgi:guanosine-3',5'-bis(diphosphate) 3'-pyrophosphohydrolase